MRFPRWHPLAFALGLVAIACTGGSDSIPVVTGTSPPGEIVVGDTAPPDSPPLPPTCPADTPVVSSEGDNPSIEFFDEGPGLASVHVSQATFECATRAVIVSDADLNRVAIAAVLAAALGAPLLIDSANASGVIGFEAERLAPEQIIAVGDDAAFIAPEWTEIVTLLGNTADLAGQANSLAGFESTIPLPVETGIATLITTINALEVGAGLEPSATPVPVVCHSMLSKMSEVRPLPLFGLGRFRH